jgi:hypothetical protein
LPFVRTSYGYDTETGEYDPQEIAAQGPRRRGLANFLAERPELLSARLSATQARGGGGNPGGSVSEVLVRGVAVNLCASLLDAAPKHWDCTRTEFTCSDCLRCRISRLGSVPLRTRCISCPSCKLNCKRTRRDVLIRLGKRRYENRLCLALSGTARYRSAPVGTSWLG